MNPKILILATSRHTRGGITAVLKMYEKMEDWQKFHCRWLETHKDKGLFVKFAYFLYSFVKYLFIVPFYDIVHIHIGEPPSAMRKIPFFKIAKLYGKKIIVHYHSFSPETTIGGKWQFLYKQMFVPADVVIVLSNQWKQWVRQYIGISENVAVLYNPCNDIMIRQKNQILFAGTLNGRKGYADLIRAFALIAKNYPGWSVIFAGNGETEQAKILSKELDIENQTVFAGWLDGEAKDRKFREASVFCLPSYAEGFPMAVLDAWSYGLPVITTPVGGLPDIVENGKNVLLFDAGNIQQLAAQLEKMIIDENLRKSIAAESLKLVETKFSLKIINGELAKIYEDLIKK